MNIKHALNNDYKCVIFALKIFNNGVKTDVLMCFVFLFFLPLSLFH